MTREPTDPVVLLAAVQLPEIAAVLDAAMLVAMRMMVPSHLEAKLTQLETALPAGFPE